MGRVDAAAFDADNVRAQRYGAGAVELLEQLRPVPLKTPIALYSIGLVREGESIALAKPVWLLTDIEPVPSFLRDQY